MNTVYCELCMVDYELEDCISMWNCEHAFNKECFFMVLETNIKENKVTESNLLCPKAGCNKPFGGEFVLSILELMGKTELLEKFERFILGNL
mmetsp:Transcript_32666/g.5933  ORF Transcript_32666/g.5933 Transcript_32666/m.5933 type:complete len:92 (+) Transcript_32666:774-1049(+)